MLKSTYILINYDNYKEAFIKALTYFDDKLKHSEYTSDDLEFLIYNIRIPLKAIISNNDRLAYIEFLMNRDAIDDTSDDLKPLTLEKQLLKYIDNLIV